VCPRILSHIASGHGFVGGVHHHGVPTYPRQLPTVFELVVKPIIDLF
jgi:hypothetical protein